ncbi:MAG: hypothetical protein V2A34_09405, partial [Lentisphaerota bacterium]
MKRIYLFLLTMSFLAACTPGLDAPISNDKPQLPGGDDPVSSDDPLPPKTDNTIPRHGDDALLRGNVYLDSIDLLTMESYPLQFSLALTGSLPTPCYQLRVSVSPPDGDNRILVEVYSLSSPDTICAQVLQPFSQNIPLGSFP